MIEAHLYPAILTQSREEFEHQLGLVKQDGRLNIVQVDIIDGLFVDNITLFPSDLNVVDFGDLQVDIHLLTDEPIDMVHEIIDSYPPLPVRSIIAQVEHLSYQDQFVSEVKNMGWRVGLSLDLFTPPEAVDAAIWPQLDIVQVMGNEAGFQGKQLDERAVDKIHSIYAGGLLSENAELVVDVGVTPETIAQLKQAGATGFCAGSSLWKSNDFSKTVSEFLSRIAS